MDGKWLAVALLLLASQLVLIKGQQHSTLYAECPDVPEDWLPECWVAGEFVCTA